MAGSVIDRLKSAWNTFLDVDKRIDYLDDDGYEQYNVIISSGNRPDRGRCRHHD